MFIFIPLWSWRCHLTQTGLCPCSPAWHRQPCTCWKILPIDELLLLLSVITDRQTDHTQQNCESKWEDEGRTLMKVGLHTLKVVLICLKSPGGMEQLNDSQGFLSSLQLWKKEKLCEKNTYHQISISHIHEKSTAYSPKDIHSRSLF